ncbi:MAG: hypothetical protein KGL39_44100 [Patescibacteria group bacterium]|nr:hypothetical protein [Patescibacteria group bacterium]
MPRCNWCFDKGCLACPPPPTKQELLDDALLFKADRNNPHDMELVRQVFGAEAMEKAFGPNGGGMADVQLNAALARLLQAIHRSDKAEVE